MDRERRKFVAGALTFTVTVSAPFVLRQFAPPAPNIVVNTSVANSCGVFVTVTSCPPPAR